MQLSVSFNNDTESYGVLVNHCEYQQTNKLSALVMVCFEIYQIILSTFLPQKVWDRFSD